LQQSFIELQASLTFFRKNYFFLRQIPAAVAAIAGAGCRFLFSTDWKDTNLTAEQPQVKGAERQQGRRLRSLLEKPLLLRPDHRPLLPTI